MTPHAGGNGEESDWPASDAGAPASCGRDRRGGRRAIRRGVHGRAREPRKAGRGSGPGRSPGAAVTR